jgi:outer membrane protein assembly factor BamB
MQNKSFLTIAVSAACIATALSGCASDKKPTLKGERIAVLDIQDSAASNSGEMIALALADQKENTAWPQAGGNAAHMPQNLALNSGNLKKIWTVDIGEGSEEDRKLITAPIAADGRVFAADTEGTITAYSIDKGKKIWSMNILPKDDDSATVSSGISYANGIVYVNDGIGHVAALDAQNGKKIWNSTLEQPARGSPTVQENRLYLITLNDETIALDTKDGSLVWRHEGVQESAGLLGAPSPAVDGSVVITTYSSGDVVALRSETGQEAWSDNLTGVTEFQSRAATQLSGFRGNPVLDQSVVIVGNASSRMVAIHVPSGERIWQKEFGLMSTPWVSGNGVFAITAQNELVAFTKENGRVVWTLPLGRFEDPQAKEDPIFWSGPIMAGGKLIVAGSNEELLEIDPINGTILRKTELPDPAMLAPIVAQNSLIVLTDTGKMVAYK